MPVLQKSRVTVYKHDDNGRKVKGPDGKYIVEWYAEHDVDIRRGEDKALWDKNAARQTLVDAAVYFRYIGKEMTDKLMSQPFTPDMVEEWRASMSGPGRGRPNLGKQIEQKGLTPEQRREAEAMRKKLLEMGFSV